MDADILNGSEDVVRDVLDDEECQKALYKGLKKFILESPLAFYKAFVMPRMPRFKDAPVNAEFTEMTPSDMDMLTSPEEYEKASNAIFAEINGANRR